MNDRRSFARGLVPALLALAATNPAPVTALHRLERSGATTEPLRFVQEWSVRLPDTGRPVALSSPNVATIGGRPAVVVGDRAGFVYALSLADGHNMPGWPASTGGIPVDSTPSVYALQPGSPDDTIFVGVGDVSTTREGGYEAFGADGRALWFVHVKNPRSDRAAGASSPVQASLAVGDLQGSADVVAPSLSQEEYALDAATGTTLRGFPWFTADDDFSTPALAALYGGNKTYIVEGGDSTPGTSYGTRYGRGGHLRVIEPTGRAGSSNPSGGLVCEYNADQAVESSPAVGPFLADGATGIAVGTGTYWAGASQSDTLLALGTHCQLVWSQLLDGATTSSPALVGVGSRLDVAEGTNEGDGRGSAYVLDGATGSVLWRRALPGAVIGSVVAADLGSGYEDLVVPTTHGAYVLVASSGRLVAVLGSKLGLQSSPLVTNDPNGTVGITLAGYNAREQGEVVHLEVPGSRGSSAAGPGSWPMFHHDPQLTGVSGRLAGPAG